MVFASLQTPDRESIEALERIVATFARPMNVQTILNTHPGIFQDRLSWMATLRQNPDGPHPFLYGLERFDRYLSIMIECGRARVAAMESTRP